MEVILSGTPSGSVSAVGQVDEILVAVAELFFSIFQPSTVQTVEGYRCWLQTAFFRNAICCLTDVCDLVVEEPQLVVRCRQAGTELLISSSS